MHIYLIQEIEVLLQSNFASERDISRIVIRP